jgi:hypothetical protein
LAGVANQVFHALKALEVCTGIVAGLYRAEQHGFELLRSMVRRNWQTTRWRCGAGTERLRSPRTSFQSLGHQGKPRVEELSPGISRESWPLGIRAANAYVE